jgi:hypothetical protein
MVKAHMTVTIADMPEVQEAIAALAKERDDAKAELAVALRLLHEMTNLGPHVAAEEMLLRHGVRKAYTGDELLAKYAEFLPDRGRQ